MICVEIDGAFVLNRRVVLHAIDLLSTQVATGRKEDEEEVEAEEGLSN